ncbi:Heparanase-like protein [Thalictrum thalictroides]|uniref:Heparanase-like protein n=1 Tax=Thalictrum thalictroides TaxID=46969 RepID=A0A7J6X0X5_THATH|nr:Heparanase-like protein [Thalictrum thalictroides]
MVVRIISLVLVISNLSLCLLAEDVTVKVQSVTNIATTDDNFVCATLDWWPSNKCDYNQCPWGKAGLFNLDLENKILSNSIKAFNSLRIRIGGSLQDQIIYKIGNAIKNCTHMKRSRDGSHGFTEGCLTTERWDQIIDLQNKTGAVLAFGLNALIGRNYSSDDDQYVGDWYTRNARDLIEYTVSKGYSVDSWELGNELCGSMVTAKQYAKDVTALRKILDKLYNKSTVQPKILAPGCIYDEDWYHTFLQSSGPNVVDVATHHIYNLGPGDDPDLIHKVQDPLYLDQVAQTYKEVETTVTSFPWTSAWVGESGGAYNSGGKTVSHTYVNSFWYLDQLGMTSKFNHKVFCRQTLIGGNYGLLNTTTFVPNPDYYSALLWHRLMGKNVLSTTHNGTPYLRAYSHCSKNKTGITLLLINMSNSTSLHVSVANHLNLHPKGGKAREEYHLTPKDNNVQSDVMLLNGSPLVLTKTLDIPALNPVLVDPSSPIYIVPDSIVFVALRDFQAPACA